MIAHDDRILHWALRVLLRREKDEDLAQDVLEAWERGEVGSWTPDDAEPGEPVPLRRAPARRSWVRYAAAASVLVVGGLAFLALRPGPGEPASEGVVADAAGPPADPGTPTTTPAFAVAARPLERLAAAQSGGPGGTTTSLAPGERVLVGEDEPAPVEIRLAGGGRILADPGTLLAIDEGGQELTLRIELGGASVRRGGGPTVSVDAGFARLAPDPWAAFRVAVQPDDAAWIGAAAPSAVAALARGDELPRVLLVTMEAGSAQLFSPAESEGWTLRENDATHVLSEPGSSASVARADVEWLAGLCRRAAPRAEEEKSSPWGPARGTNLADDDAEEAQGELRIFLDEQPERWALLQPVLFDLVREERPGSYFGSVLDVIADDPSPGAVRAARALWRELPERFSEDHVVALAATGAFEFEREARARVAAWSFGDEPAPVRSAAWLASTGDESGRRLLEEVAQAEITDRDALLDVYTAALALDALGRPEPWESARGATVQFALQALELGREEAARSMAAAIDYVETLRAEGQPLPVAFLGRRMDRHMRRREADLETEAAVRELLESFGG